MATDSPPNTVIYHESNAEVPKIRMCRFRYILLSLEALIAEPCSLAQVRIPDSSMGGLTNVPETMLCCRDTETQRHRDTERHRDAETQRHRDTETQRHRVPTPRRTQAALVSWTRVWLNVWSSFIMVT